MYANSAIESSARKRQCHGDEVGDQQSGEVVEAVLKVESVEFSRSRTTDKAQTFDRRSLWPTYHQRHPSERVRVDFGELSVDLRFEWFVWQRAPCRHEAVVDKQEQIDDADEQSTASRNV